MHATLEPSLNTDTHSAPLPIWRAVLFRFAFVYWLLAILVIVTNEDVGVTWFGNNASGKFYAVDIDDKQQTMTFIPDDNDREEAALGPMAFHYVRSAPDHLRLEGKVGAVALSVELQKLDVGKSLLMSRGFHWISEEPYNR